MKTIPSLWRNVIIRLFASKTRRNTSLLTRVSRTISGLWVSPPPPSPPSLKNSYPVSPWMSWRHHSWGTHWTYAEVVFGEEFDLRTLERDFSPLSFLSIRLFDFLFVKDNQKSKMPLVFLEQLPLPSLRSYVTASVLLFVSAILYALNVTVGSGENDVPTLYDFMSQDNFCFWVSWTMLFEVPFLLIIGHSSHICPSILVSLVELEHGLLWFVFVWKNYPASRVWRSSRQWTSGECGRRTRRFGFRFIKRASTLAKLVSFVTLS